VKYLSSLFLVMSLSAIAQPAVGDKVVYSVTMARDTATFTKEVTSVDAVKGNYTVRNTDNLYGSHDYSATSEWAKENKWIGSASSLQTCKDLLDGSRAGSFASLESLTIMGTTIQACHIRPSQGEDWWFGDVPFGLIKKEIRPDDVFTRMTSELVSFEKH
jgi:hypothetical protein